MSTKAVISGIDKAVDNFSKHNSMLNDPMTKGRAYMFVMQHRLNTRQRNSVLKLRVATNTPVWDVKMDILEACVEELVSDVEHGDGRPHWKVLEDLGVDCGMRRPQISNAKPLPSTRLAWRAWDGLMSNRHWLLGLMANTCAERANIPGYGKGEVRKKGWFGNENRRWGKLFDLTDDQRLFFGMHSEADIKHSDLGWKTVANQAAKLHMEDEVVDACEENLIVWDHYLNGIAEAGDVLSKKMGWRKSIK
jgi:pyrroloquinoline quinone (PQQ) biosynthesis protein C